MSSQSVYGSPGLTEKLKSSMSRMGQIGSLIWMFMGTYSPCVGLTLSGGQIDGDAVEAGVHVLPAVRQAAAGPRRRARGSLRE